MSSNSEHNQTLLIGALAGAALGIIAAHLYSRSVQRNTALQTGQPAFNGAQAVAIGLAVLGILRQIAGLPDEQPKKQGRKR
jgi:hypothetical protein